MCSSCLGGDILIVTALDKNLSPFVVRGVIEDEAEFGRTNQLATLKPHLSPPPTVNSSHFASVSIRRNSVGSRRNSISSVHSYFLICFDGGMPAGLQTRLMPPRPHEWWGSTGWGLKKDSGWCGCVQLASWYWGSITQTPRHSDSPAPPRPQTSYGRGTPREASSGSTRTWSSVFAVI